MTRFAYFERFQIEMTEEQAASASHSGQCDDDVAALLTVPEITRQLDSIAPDLIRAELREYGAWDADELADDAANRARIVWCAACDIREDKYGERRT
jgi:hypothetical protein